MSANRTTGVGIAEDRTGPANPTDKIKSAAQMSPNAPKGSNVVVIVLVAVVAWVAFARGK